MTKPLGKSDIIDYIAAETGLTKTQAKAVVDSVFANIADALQRGETVTIPSFGTFSAEGKGANTPKIPEEVENPERFPEGATRRIAINAYERSSKARAKCIEHYGPKCLVCGFDFAKTYGEMGRGFIVVHHLKPLSDIGKEYEVDPVADLRPVCPNCHAMLHSKDQDQPLGIDDLKQVLVR